MRTREELLTMWSDAQMRAAYYQAQMSKVADILYDLEEGFREEERIRREEAVGVCVTPTPTARDVVRRLRDGGAEVYNRWRADPELNGRHWLL